MRTIGNCDVREIVEEFGSPLYVYDKEIIEDNYRCLAGSFAEFYPESRVHFSVKANSNLHILKIFRELGCGADCSSPFELMLAIKAGFSPGKILYTGNYESNSDLETALSSNIRINFDDINSFRRAMKIKLPELMAFRINPGIGRGGYEGITTAGSDAKFGVPYEKAYDAYKLAVESGVKRFGIHMMTGSNNLEPYYFAEVTEKLLRIAGETFGRLGIVPEYIDIGGGFGVPYTTEEEPLNIRLTAELISEVITEKCEKYGFGSPALLLEPGRYLAANAGFLVTTVSGIKNSYKTFVGLDAGMSVLIRPALYGAFHRIEVYGKDTLDSNVNLCGNICENSDIFAKGIFMPGMSEGDIVIFRDAGAYGYVMSSNYNNRPRPAEVIVDGSAAKLIRRRENFEDFLRLYE